MKSLAATAACALVLFLALGCAEKKQTAGNSVTDVGPAPMAAATYPPVSQQPAPVIAQPVSYDTPSVTSGASGQTAISGNTYTVKKGDTLFGIARSKYGDGKQWKKIAAANPGVSPQSLKVGQTITLP